MLLTRWPQGVRWLVAIGAGLALGQGLGLLHLPAAAMVGPMVAGAAVALAGGRLYVAPQLSQMGQGVAGCLIALNLDAGALRQTLAIWPVVLVFVALTFAVACLSGLAASRWTRLGREVTLWGFLPGMMGTIIALAHERGLDSRMIALIQILRLMLVIAAMVVVAAGISGPAPPPAHAGSPAIAVALAALGVAAARWLPRIPAAATLVPLSLATVLVLNGVALAVPGWLVALAFLAIGLQVGLRFTPDLLRQGLVALPGLCAACLLLIGLCGASGLALSRIAGVGVMTGMLATVPGSIDSIAILAIGAGADVAFVMTLQTVRLFAVVIFGPILASAIARWMDR
ncbi:AbrB family transcriptional regulator [Paenirhodobacter sp.]|uniref:AbrB family transcriptional regulator n=1 Tax=Paenirhodobacter sp. TaxID=1965326 RepID=UPI003B40CF55